jgi:DNA-binding beta-propeller fold protein YncE
MIAGYAIDDAGGIHPLPESPFNTRTGPRFVEIDPGGRYLYVSYHEAGTASVFSIDAATGALAAVAGSSTRPVLHPHLRPFVLPAVVTDAASLPAPESTGLQPIQTIAPPAPDAENHRQEPVE